MISDRMLGVRSLVAEATQAIRLSLGCAVVIATRHRPGPLKECMRSLAAQSHPPNEVIIVDSSTDAETKEMVTAFSQLAPFRLIYLHSAIASSAHQRNLGAHKVQADIVFFLDDDVILEPAFVLEVVQVFEKDIDSGIGGVGGTITNMTYIEPRGLNRLLLGLCLGCFRGTFAGRILGPAVNFIPVDGADLLQRVDWLPSTACAYRTSTFREYQFGETFEGYSFAEDLHLSARVGQTQQLLNTTRARVFHSDLGASTHKDWSAVAESMVVNRHMIMTTVLGKTRARDYTRLMFYEVVYCQAAFLAAGLTASRFKIAIQMLRGKLRGAVKILRQGEA